MDSQKVIDHSHRLLSSPMTREISDRCNTRKTLNLYEEPLLNLRVVLIFYPLNEEISPYEKV